jgi:hypothetical protein
MPIDLAATILNWLASAWRSDVITMGDNVEIPLGIPNAEDANGVFWIGELELAVDVTGPMPRQANASDALAIVPILWSSPLGWRE